MRTYALAITALVAGPALLSGPSAQAASVPALTNAEILADGADSEGDSSGIRTFSGSTSTLFFNVQGSNNGQFARFGVADFDIPDLAPGQSIDTASLSLILEEDPAGFGAAGTIEVYAANVNDANLIDATANPSAGTPAYQGGDSLAAIDPAFQPGNLLGTGSFTPTAAGNQTVIALTLDGVALAELNAASSSSSTFRLIVAAGDANVAGTFAGQSNSDGAPPTLDYTVIPEPSSLALIGLGGLFLARRRKG